MKKKELIHIVDLFINMKKEIKTIKKTQIDILKEIVTIRSIIKKRRIK